MENGRIVEQGSHSGAPGARRPVLAAVQLAVSSAAGRRHRTPNRSEPRGLRDGRRRSRACPADLLVDGPSALFGRNRCSSTIVCLECKRWSAADPVEGVASTTAASRAARRPSPPIAGDRGGRGSRLAQYRATGGSSRRAGDLNVGALARALRRSTRPRRTPAVRTRLVAKRLISRGPVRVRGRREITLAITAAGAAGLLETVDGPAPAGRSEKIIESLSRRRAAAASPTRSHCSGGGRGGASRRRRGQLGWNVSRGAPIAPARGSFPGGVAWRLAVRRPCFTGLAVAGFERLTVNVIFDRGDRASALWLLALAPGFGLALAGLWLTRSGGGATTARPRPTAYLQAFHDESPLGLRALFHRFRRRGSATIGTGGAPRASKDRRSTPAPRSAPSCNGGFGRFLLGTDPNLFAGRGAAAAGIAAIFKGACDGRDLLRSKSRTGTTWRGACWLPGPRRCRVGLRGTRRSERQPRPLVPDLRIAADRVRRSLPARPALRASPAGCGAAACSRGCCAGPSR